MGHYWGLCYLHNNQPVSLPLLSVRASASIKELGAQVKITQTFANDASALPLAAVYSFPVPARAAVCGFTMIKQDGTRIQGRVEGKAEAKETYDTAVAEGKTASLMAQQTPDVFQVSVGNIEPNEQVQIELVYATELTEDEDNDSIRFHLPSHIGTRYGLAPSSFVHSTTSFIEVNISVAATSPIRKIGSPSHSISTELGPDPSIPGVQDLSFANYARVSLASDAPFQKDFVLTIQASGLDAPRCIAEFHPNDNTLGMALTLVPRFTLPEPKTQEFVFLVDRSGSMKGSRIAAARKALVVMLRSLPHKGTCFQIVSFGSSTSMLWSHGSHPYNQETLDEATHHVDGMQANMGGTEIAHALSTSFEHRLTDRPTNVIVLTDGDSWNNAHVFETVKRAVAAASSSAYLRVFCLGIGNTASTAMCEGIARTGNGVSMMVGEDEASITGKIARLLKAAKSPRILDVRVDWGRPVVQVQDQDREVEDEFEIVEADKDAEEQQPTQKKLNIFDETDDSVQLNTTPPPPPEPIVLPPPTDVQQSPLKIDTLLPGCRLYVYAILQGTDTLSKTVTIRGTTSDGADIELPVSVTLSNLPNEDRNAPPVIHALAAHRIIQELEDGRYTDNLQMTQSYVKAHIVRLGKMYSIGSSETSFVAVDDKPERRPASPPSMRRPQMQMPIGGMGRGVGITGPRTVQVDRQRDTERLRFKRELKSSRVTRIIHDPQSSSGLESYAYDAVSSLVVTPDRSTVPEKEMDVLEKLARLQAFDGSFSVAVLPILKADLTLDGVKASFEASLTDAVVVTLMAVAFIAQRMQVEAADGKAAWGGIYEKAQDYLRGELQHVDELVEKATVLL